MEDQNINPPAEEIIEKAAGTEKAENQPAAEEKESGKKQKKKCSIGKRIVKWVLRSVAAIFLLLIILVTAVLIFIDPIVKTAIVKIGPKVAGVDIELEDISVQIFKGRVEITNMVIGNPAGYNSEYAAHLGDIAVETDILSWLGEGKKIIRDIKIKDVTINYETTLPFSNNSNLDDIVNHIKAVAAGEIPVSGQTALSYHSAKFICASIFPVMPGDANIPVAVNDGQKRFQIDKISIKNVRLVVVPKDFPNFSVPLTITLPEMGPVGTNPEGLTGPEIAAELAGQILLGIVRSVHDSSKEIYQNLSSQGLQAADAFITGVQQTVDSARQQGEEAAAAARDAVDNARQQVQQIENDIRERSQKAGEAVDQLKDKGRDILNNFRNR